MDIMKKLSEYVHLYLSLVEKKEHDKLRNLIFNVTQKVKNGQFSKNEKQFFEYLWSFQRSTGKHANKLTNNLLQEAFYNDPMSPKTPKLKKIKLR